MLMDSPINIVLITPEIPQNTGNIIRLCANVGARLHLVEPLAFQLDDTSLKRAALDYRDLTDVVVYPSIEDFVATKSFDNTYATTTHGIKTYSNVRYKSGDTLIFGPESVGLPQAIISHVPEGNLISIPMMPNNRSLNLSNAVAVVAYEMWRQLGYSKNNLSSRE